MPLDVETPWLHEKTWKEVEAYLTDNDTILIPVGATEQHGHHTPLFVDTGWAIHIAEQTAKRCGLLVAPPIHVAISEHHMGYPGTLTLRPETLIQLLEDIGNSLIRHGFRKLIIVNGNRIANLPPLDIAAANLRHGTGAYVAVVDVALIAKREIFDVCGHNLGHAGDSETSFMLHAFPDFVRVDQAVWTDGAEATNQKRYTGLHAVIEEPFDRSTAFVWPTAIEYRASSEKNAGIGGDPRSATPEKGARIVNAIVDNFAEFFENEVRPLTVTLTGGNVNR